MTNGCHCLGFYDARHGMGLQRALDGIGDLGSANACAAGDMGASRKGAPGPSGRCPEAQNDEAHSTAATFNSRASGLVHWPFAYITRVADAECDAFAAHRISA
jgi:hypothetical protein